MLFSQLLVASKHRIRSITKKMINSSKKRATLFLVITLLILKILEIALDVILGDGDGEMVIVRYIQVLLIGIYFLFISSKLNSKRFSNIILSFGSLLIFVTIIELTFHITVNLFLPESPYTSNLKTNYEENNFTEYDINLGYKATPLSTSTEIQYFKGKEILTAKYNIDSISRRITTQSFKSKLDKKYACFFGCSFTFGNLVNDDQTLPSNFSKLDTNYRSYNYGFNGYGTQHLLSTLQNKKLAHEIKEKDGIFIYTFIDPHIRRAIGDQFVMETNKWFNELPYYSLKNDSLSKKGSFGKDRSGLNYVYKLLSKSYFLRFFSIKFPITNKEKHVMLVGKMIDKSFIEYKKQFNNDNFFVVIFPGQKTRLGDYIKESRIKILDYSKLFDFGDSNYHIPGDYHPSSLAYKLVSNQLFNDITEYYERNKNIPAPNKK